MNDQKDWRVELIALIVLLAFIGGVMMIGGGQC